MRLLTWGGLCLLFVYGAPAGAQEIDFDRTEAWAMKYFSAIALMSGYGPPNRTDPGSVSLGFEAGWVPHLSRAERTVGFDGTNVEDLNKTSVFGRLRVDLALPWELHATLGYVPPIELDGARPDVLSLSIGREIWAGENVRFGLRAHAMGGDVEGDFTCEEDAVAAGDDPVANPLGCEEVSRDRMRFDALGLEGGIGFTPWSASGPEIYAAVSVSRIDPRFQVNARYSGFTDRTVLETEGTLATFSAGLRDDLAGRWSWAAEAVYAPLTVRRPPEREEENDDILTARTMLTVSWR
ncbi:MAG: hypothetical protein ACRD2Z_13775 [Thermoanaerobaculia bacterium]